MRVPKRIISLTLAGLMTSGCNLPLSRPAPTTVAPVEQAEATSPPATPVVLPSPTSTATPTASPEVTPHPISCPVQNDSPAAPALQAPASYVQEVLAFLNGGGSPHDLQADIRSAGLSLKAGIPLAQQDFNGDRLDDIAVTLLTPSETSIVATGDLYVFVCTGQAYALAYTSAPSPEVGAPEIIDARDMNADGAADLLLARESCGAHTCFDQIELLSWQQNAMVNVLQGESDDLPYPSIRVVGPDPNGRFQVAVSGTGIGSAGAGPYRGVTRTWSWNAAGDALVPGPDLVPPPIYRIHVLNDADQADRDGDFATALQLYDRVIHDDSLQDWVDPASERANLSAYAMFRETLIQLQLNDAAAAQNAYQALQSAYPPASLGGAYALLGQALWSAYQASSSLPLACAQAQAFAQTNETTILQPLYFGYANPQYTAADVCPASTP
jgi:hypothetical protein